jgi:MFS family permease
MTQLIGFWNSLSRDQRWISLALFLSGIAEGLWWHLQPVYLKHLGADPIQIGQALSLANVLIIFVYIPSGLLADRGRRKLMILTAWGMAVVAFGLIALAPDWRWVIPGFALNLLASFARPALSGQIAASDVSGNVSRAFAVASISFSIGSLFSPALGGWIAEAFGLRMVFATAGGIYVLATVCFLPLSNQRITVHREGGLSLRHLLSDRQFLWQIAFVFLLTFALDAGVVLAPNFLQEAKGLTFQQIGQLGTLASLGGMTFSLLNAQFPAGRKRALLISQGTVMSALALLLLAPPAQAGVVPVVLSLAYFLRGAVDSLWAPIAGRLSAWLTPDLLSLGFGFRDTAMRVALTLSPLAAGQLYAAAPAYPLYLGLVGLAFTIALTFTLPRRQPQPAPATD